MQTLSFAPIPAPLQPYVGTLYSGIAEPGITPLPSLLAQLWVCTFPVWWQAPGASSMQRLPPVALMGPLNGAHRVFVQEPGLILGIGFWPRGWSELVRVSAAELADGVVDASALWPGLCTELLDRTAQARGWAGKANALSRFTMQLLGASTSRDERPLIAAIDRWLIGNNPLDALTATLALSARQTERIVTRTHGGSPRLMRAKHRALRAAAAYTQVPGPEAWREYADQSHFIREFKRFIGGTPSTFGLDSGIGRSVVEKSWNGDPDHPLALRRRDAEESD